MAHFDYYTTRGMGTVPKFASTSPASAIAWVHQWIAHHQERRPMRLLKIVEVLEENEPQEEDISAMVRKQFGHDEWGGKE